MLKQLIFLMAVVPTSCETLYLKSAGVSSVNSTEQTQQNSRLERVASSTCPTLSNTTPRGLSCLHCMHPKATEQRKVISKIMQDSCLLNLTTNFLVDGTFSFDLNAVLDVVNPLLADGRQLFVTFYLTNGSTQRRWKNTKVNGFATGISPEVFRENIVGNEKVQDAYRDLVTRMLPIIRYLNSKGAKVQLIPALEDNLDDLSFQKMADLTLEVLPDDLLASIGRNPCPKCYQGNTSFVPNGYFHEVHSASPEAVVRDGIITNDGEAASLGQLVAVRDRAAISNSQFVLWSAARQGLPSDLRTYPEVDQRNYLIPDMAEQQELVRFLSAN